MNKVVFKISLTFCLVLLNFDLICQPLINITGFDDTDTYLYNMYTIKNYYFVIEDDIGLKQKIALFAFYGLDTNKTYKVSFNKIYFNNTSYKSFYIRTDNFGNSSMNFVSLDTLNGSGIYDIEIWDSIGLNLLHHFDNKYIVLEKTTELVIPSAPYSFLIFYIDDFFYSHPNGIVHAPVFINNVKNSLIEAWNKQVVTWNLCAGINKNGIIDLPCDSDSYYKIYINNFTDLFPNAKFCYHNGDEFSGCINDYDRHIHTDCMLMNTFRANSNLISEEALLLKSIMHEFFHGIQWSHMSYNKLRNNFITQSQADDELKHRMWLFEGQAKFFETVFMEYYRTNGRNEGYSIAHKGTYEEYCKAIMFNTLDQNYQHFDFHHQGYKAALFWRLIYEHNYNAPVSERNKLSILKETCKAYDAIDTSNLTDIKTFMEQELINANNHNGGVFTSFDDLIIDFAEKVYFHDTSWVYDTGGYLNCWDDPNKENFYTMISTSIVEDNSFDDIPACNSKDSNIFDIRVPFMFRTHYHTRSSCSGPEKIVFNSDPYNTGNYAKYNVNCFITDGFTLKEKHPLLLKNGIGELVLCTSGTEKIIIIVTRLDDKTTNPNDDYQIKIDGTISNPPFDFSASWDIAGNPATVNFIDRTDTAYFPELKWNFGNSKTSIERNPQCTYNRSGDYNVTLTSTLCKDKSYATAYSEMKDSFIRILPPYITEAAIKNLTAGTNAYNFSRVYTGAGFAFNMIQNYLVAKSGMIEVKATTYLPLKSLGISLLRPDGKVMFNTNMIRNINGVEYSCLIPSDSCNTGLNILKLYGKDSSGIEIISIREPQYPPVYVDSANTGWDLKVSLITGKDINYGFLTLTNDTNQFFKAYVRSECDENYNAIFANNSTEYYTIEFGDGDISAFHPQTFVFHEFKNEKKEYKVTIKKGTEVLRVFDISFKKW